MSKTEQEFSIDPLMDRVVATPMSKLPTDEIVALLNDVYSPRWLTLQALMNGEINLKLNELSTQKLTEEGALLKMARLQGEIDGLRRFWFVLEEIVKQPKEDKES